MMLSEKLLTNEQLYDFIYMGFVEKSNSQRHKNDNYQGPEVNGKKEELLFNVSLWEDEKVLGMDNSNSCYTAI